MWFKPLSLFIIHLTFNFKYQPGHFKIINLDNLFKNFPDWDLGVCLHYECIRKQIRKPQFFNQWIDIRATYRVSSVKKG